MAAQYFILTTNLERCRSLLESEGIFRVIRPRQPDSKGFLDSVLNKLPEERPETKFVFYDRVPTNVETFRKLTTVYALRDIRPDEEYGDYQIVLDREQTLDPPIPFSPGDILWERLHSTGGKRLIDFFAGARVLIPIPSDDFEEVVAYAPEDIEEELIAAVQQGATVAEAELKNYLKDHLEDLEVGLRPYDADHIVEFQTADRGRIDILAVDKTGATVVIELKKGEPGDDVVGQLCRYMGWVKSELTPEKPVRGIIVASTIGQRVRYAVKVVPNVKLISYEVIFKFDRDVGV